MAINDWNLYDELHYSDMYFEGEPMEESNQDDFEIEAAELDLSDVDEDLSGLDDFEDFDQMV